MIIAAIVACEVGFWLLLALGLIARYGLHRPRLGAVLLLAVPVVDLALLVLTAVDLRSGTPATTAHGLAAVYLGCSLAYGHALVQWADVRVAHRWRGGPPPARGPASGTTARVRAEWRAYGRACLAAALSAAFLLLAAAVAGGGADIGALLAWLPRLAVVLLVWLVGWPVWETLRDLGRPRARAS